MEIELYSGASAFTAELEVDEETGEILSSFDFRGLVQRNPVGTIAYIEHTLGVADKIEERIAELEKMYKRHVNNARRAKESLEYTMKASGVSRIESPDHTFKAVLYSQRDVSVEVFDMNHLPEKFIRSKITLNADRALIKAEIESGNEVPGATLVYKDRLTLS